jgi:hypothetical protein
VAITSRQRLKKRTRRERFLAEMEKVVPWKALIDLIEPHYPKISSKGGRPPYPLTTMLRIHLLQQWYDLSDPAIQRSSDPAIQRSSDGGCTDRGADDAPFRRDRHDRRSNP